MLINCNDIFIDESFNSRGFIAPIDVSSLAKTIEENGQLQPILVRTMSPEWERVTGKKYNLVCGFRRYTAKAKVLCHEQILAEVRENMSDEEARVINAIENIERAELTLMQEAKVVSELKSNYGLGREAIAKRLNKSPAWVQLREQANSMPDVIKTALDKKELTQTDLRQLYTLRNSPDEQLERAKKLRQKNLKLLSKQEEFELIKTEKKTKSNIKRIRSPQEIELMQDTIRNLKGNGLETRLLGWCAGFVNDIDIHTELNKLFPQHQIPEELINAQFSS